MICCYSFDVVRCWTRGYGQLMAAFEGANWSRRCSYSNQLGRCGWRTKVVQGIEVEYVGVGIRRADDLLALCRRIRCVGGRSPERRIRTRRIMSATVYSMRSRAGKLTQSGLLAAERHVSYPRCCDACAFAEVHEPTWTISCANNILARVAWCCVVSSRGAYLLLLLHPGGSVRTSRFWGITLLRSPRSTLVCP